MALQDLALRSQLIPPRGHKGVLRRPALEARLQAILDYPLTLVQAGTGYGKTTALAWLADFVNPLFWYSISAPDRDPLLFLIHLLCAFDQSPCACTDIALKRLEETNGRVTPAALTPLLNSLTDKLDIEAVLVLDDYHRVQDVPEIAALVSQLVNYRPPHLHVVISGRRAPALADLSNWRAKGQVWTVTQVDLAFSAPEIERLFRDQHHYPLTSAQASALAAETEGWAIALQMIWQGLQSGAIPDLDAVLGHISSKLEALFDYLAPEVLARLPANTQTFLLYTSILRQMDGPTCDAIFEESGSQEVLARLHENGMFLDTNGQGVYRYQNLFHEFLESELKKKGQLFHDLNCQAAAYFEHNGRPEEMIYHLLQAAGDQELARAAAELEQIGPELVRAGRFDSLTSWISRLPEEVRKKDAGLELLLGDVLRLRANFDDALDHYSNAERLYIARGDKRGRSQALLSQAEVFLDTVRPIKADSLLEEALRLLEPQEHRQEVALLLDKLAENKLNLGYPDQAQSLHREALLLRAEADPGDVYLEARAFLRTGRLEEAQALLENRAADERQSRQLRPPRFHRETLLLLSLICIMRGDARTAEQCAREGIEIGRQLSSDFVEAVGYIRLGHALQLGTYNPWGDSRRQEAVGCYLRAIEQVRPFKVTRVRVEPLWGLCRAYGYAGEIGEAEKCALQAVEFAGQAGDEWIGSLARVSMGASFVMAGQPEAAAKWLSEADASFERVCDPFSRCASLLWLALNAWQHGDPDQACQYLETLLPIASSHRYDRLLTARTFLGLKDDQAAIPLLIEARRRGIEPAYTGRLLAQHGLAGEEDHPGYTLWVRALGALAVWRGSEPVSPHEWQRGKARQLFQLFLNYRKQWLQRDQIVDLLWPNLAPEAAVRDFKVALNALNHALEPARSRLAQPFFVVRRELAYSLNPAAHIELDVDRFEQLAASSDLNDLRRALAVYEDDYLPESCYEDWSASRRDQLRQLYLSTAGRMAQSLVEASAWDEAISVCQEALRRDNCWEAAYRLLMQAYASQGNLAQAQIVYRRCQETLEDELGIEPSPETQAVWKQLTAGRLKN